MVFAVYQFVFYGPFIGNKRLVHVDAIVTWRTDMGPDVIGFTLPKSFGFGDIISRDMDVADRIRERNLREVELGVELFYDFGSMRGMNLAYAYADGIIFSPHKQ